MKHSHDASHGRKKGYMATRIDINVKYVEGKGPNVHCDISGPTPYVLDNAIFLPLDSGDFDLYFTVSGGDLKWDDCPFGAKVGKCPEGKPPPSGTKQGQFTAYRESDSVMKLNATGQLDRSVVHYLMNFKAGNSCDPIIINGGIGGSE